MSGLFVILLFVVRLSQLMTFLLSVWLVCCYSVFCLFVCVRSYGFLVCLRFVWLVGCLLCILGFSFNSSPVPCLGSCIEGPVVLSLWFAQLCP